MIVTCLYDIGHHDDRILELRYWFEELALHGLPITVCTEPSLLPLFSQLPNSVRVLALPKECLELYSIAMSYQGELPVHRNRAKDTKEYLALLNTKLEWMYRISEIVEDDTFVWLDIGILKHIRDTHRFLDELERIHRQSFDKVVLPGWSEASSFSADTVTSHFFGCFFVVPRKHLGAFFKHSKTVLTDMCTQSMYKLCWETNIWTIIDSCAMYDDIRWYTCDQDDSLILSFPWDAVAAPPNHLLNL